jgi:hypothetical protein
VARCKRRVRVAGSEGNSIMATTPYFGWVTPAPTNFVTNLPADFELFADAVDESVSDIEIATIMAAI